MLYSPLSFGRFVTENFPTNIVKQFEPTRMTFGKILLLLTFQMGQVNLICQYIHAHFSKPTKKARRHKTWLIREIKLSQKFHTTPLSYIFKGNIGRKKNVTLFQGFQNFQTTF